MAQPALKLINSPVVEVHGVMFTALDDVWKHVEPLLQKAIDQFPEWSGHDPVHIRDSIEKRTMQLWVVLVDNKLTAAFTTSVEALPKTKSLNIHLGGGDDMDVWVHQLWKVFNDYAKSLGCQKIRGFGRQGWIKVLGVKPDKLFIWQTEVS